MTSFPTSIVAVEVLIALLLLYRSVLVYRGRLLTWYRLVTFPVLAAVLFAAAEAETAITIPWSYPLWTVLDAGLVTVAAAVMIPYGRRFITVYRSDRSGWMYRYGIELVIFYLGIWVVRLGLAAYYDPASLEFTFGPAPAISTLASDVMQVVELLFSVSTGLVIGRAIATYRLYREEFTKAPPGTLPIP